MTPDALLDSLKPDIARIDDALRASLATLVDPDGTAPPPRLLAAVEHGLMGAGKRLRPILVLSAAHAVSDHSPDEVWALAQPAALALEYIHSYSLVHDDLPALDNDDLRRGRPTVHRAFDEATAILAGDGLLTEAFRFLAQAAHRPAEQVLELVRAAGCAGMIGGQHDDLESEEQDRTLTDLAAIHRRKTGRLFGAACALGAIAVDAPAQTVEDLRTLGLALGLAFQISDDILDVTGDADTRGKKTGGDAILGKATYVRLLGLDESKRRAQEAAGTAAAIATRFGARGARLSALCHYAAERTH